MLRDNVGINLYIFRVDDSMTLATLPACTQGTEYLFPLYEM